MVGPAHHYGLPMDPPKPTSNFTMEIADGAHGSRIDLAMSSASLAMDPPCLVEIDGVTHLNGGRRRPRLGVKERET